MKAESVLPPLVMDAMAQTDRLIHKTVPCQTEKSNGIDFEVQTEIITDTITTGIQTIKQENQEIAMPNRPASRRSEADSAEPNSEPSKKRKLLPNQPTPVNSNKNILHTDTSPIAFRIGHRGPVNCLVDVRPRRRKVKMHPIKKLEPGQPRPSFDGR